MFSRMAQVVAYIGRCIVVERPIFSLVWPAEERENDGLVSADMADAIIRRITKRRKRRPFWAVWARLGRGAVRAVMDVSL